MNTLLIATALQLLSFNMHQANIFTFDYDGGACDHSVYAEFGHKGLVVIEGGGDYIGDGGIIFEQRLLNNGLVQYAVTPFNGPDDIMFFYTLEPATGYIASFEAYDLDEFKEEGILDVMKLEPCS